MECWPYMEFPAIGSIPAPTLHGRNGSLWLKIAKDVYVPDHGTEETHIWSTSPESAAYSVPPSCTQSGGFLSPGEGNKRVVNPGCLQTPSELCFVLLFLTDFAHNLKASSILAVILHSDSLQTADGSQIHIQDEWRILSPLSGRFDSRWRKVL